MARVSDKVPLAGRNKSITSTDVGSPRESEAEDYSVSSKDQLRARVYSQVVKKTSQTGAVFPIEESWISKSLLLKLPGKELAPNPEKGEP
jgi:hypothetical protein